MKKKLISFLLAVSALGSTAFAETLTADYGASGASFKSEGDDRAVIMCYDDEGKLCYSNMYKSENGEFTAAVPDEYMNAKKKIYFAATGRLMDFEIKQEETPSPTASPEASAKPSETAEPQKTLPSVYEKESDRIYAPAMVKEVSVSTGANGDDVYALTLFYAGEEISVGVETDLTIATAPEAYSYMKGETVNALREGDVICLTANISGDRIRTVDFIFRPTDEDIVTGGTDYGVNFEKLVTDGGMVAGKWAYMNYGSNTPTDRYAYAFGIIGRSDSNSFMLINKNGLEDDGIEFDLARDTIVYSCDVGAKDYELEITDRAAVRTTLPRSAFNNDEAKAELTDDYSYNYALVRIVDGTAADVILYNNYNE